MKAQMYSTRPDVERKILSILKILGSMQKPVGSHVISQRLKEAGIDLTERAVRYHLQITDERGLTQLISDRDGRIITEKGIRETANAMVGDKVGFAISRIELLAFRTNFDYETRTGVVPVNISIFDQEKFPAALTVMRPVFEKGLCVSSLVTTAAGGQMLGDIFIPPGKIGLASVCSIVINGTLLKAGIPMDSRFGGILQMQDNKPTRFCEIIHYNGSSLDPSEIFIKAKMTSVGSVIQTGTGEILANFREIPALCRPIADQVLDGLRKAGMGGVIVMGQTSDVVCEVPVDLNRVGIVLLGGLNPVAAAHEAGFEADNRSMSAVIDYNKLRPFQDIFDAYQ